MNCRKLGRTLNQRKAMLHDITTDLIINERIVATETRAEGVRSTIEKMITLGKYGDLHAHRQAATFICDEAASVCKEDEPIIVESTLQKLFNDLGPRFTEHQGGYIRILKTEPGRGGTAPMVVIEFVK